MGEKDAFRKICMRLPAAIRSQLEQLPAETICSIEEIRLRCGQNIMLLAENGEKTILYKVNASELTSTLNSLIRYSYYAYEEDLAKGFITIEGGHRVGICGKAVVKDGRTALIREISSVNIRFAKEIKGCAEKIVGFLMGRDQKPENTLIVSPAGCGKTTLLRDITRIISSQGIKTAVCDERSEIAGMYNSLPSFDLGPRTDVLDGAPKAQGMEMLIRSMSPQVIVTDEIGKSEDLRALGQCLCTGTAIIASTHGSSRSDVLNSPLGELAEKGFFRHIIYLSSKNGPGTLEGIENA